jgi:alpha-ketoglutarate-dependent taurine dioxygenase
VAYEAINLTDHIGTEIRAGVADLLQPEVAKEIRQILTERGVLVFKKLAISDEDQVTFAALLGRLREEGEKGIMKITIDPGENSKADYLKGSFLWHMDGTHDDVPVFASLLSGRRLSQVGGQTWFANSYAAYEALPQETKDRIAGMKVVHSFATSMRRAGIDPTPETEAYWNSIADKTHKLVWTHENGRKSLVIGCHAKTVVGMDPEEGAAFLQELVEWTTQPRFTYRHEWDVGDMLIWDNTGVLHRAEPYAVDSGRMMHRTTLLGEEAFA